MITEIKTWIQQNKTVTGIAIFILIGISYGIYHYFFKKKTEEETNSEAN